MNKLIVLTGRSGSGKSTVLHLLEDYGYFYIDNLPATLLEQTIRQLEIEYPLRDIVIALDSGSLNKIEHLDYVLDGIEQSTKTHSLELWYLDASDEQLITRYNETRRKHPLSHGIELPLSKALEEEKQILAPIANRVKKDINTSELSIHQLKQLIKQAADIIYSSVQINLFSFGFKYGMPRKMDFLFDVRLLPNPYWDQKLRTLSGLDEKVVQFFAKFRQSERLASDIAKFLNSWIPEFVNKDRSYLDIAIGCTGGHHRSVFIVETVAKKLSLSDITISTFHRESDKW
ncbi:MAG: RNase adapter RapZ [Gammaproteobacteria bacterium]|nr:MAG: RNase adapter RapZ [Gammaproteobacteria bacterium]UTW42928.1 RNase adapter RapZ [bacterium SCSIO 12844]